MSTKLVLMNISANLASYGIKNYLEKKGLHHADMDKKEFKELVIYMEMLASTWAHAAYSDSEYQDEEEDVIYHFFKYLFVSKDPKNPSSDPILSAAVIEKSQIDVVALLVRLKTRFNEPHSLKDIVDYATSHKMQLIFYIQALCIVIADKVVTEDEREFLDEFAEMLKLTNEEKEQQEKQYFMIIKKSKK